MTTDVIASRYKLIKKLGEGGMGVVNLVEDTTTHQQVALKVLSAKLGATDATILQFKQEFRQMAALKHPHCCAVYDFGQLPDGTPFLTMEVVPGQGLDELLPVTGERFRSIFSQLLLALGYVHSLGFVHCDIKDENARVRPDGEVRLMDFGLMERAGRASGAIKGTLGYMSPEMARGGRIDQRSDLYALGCLAYQMVTGRLPFPGDDPVAIIKAHASEPPVPPSTLAPGLAPEDEAMILRLMQKDPLQRYQSAFEVLEDLGVEVGEGADAMLLSAPFVGRESPFGFLTGRLSQLTAGRSGGALLVTGPAGAGKSRLTEEFRYSVQMENLPFVVGAAYEQGTAPYGPFVEALRALLPALREHVPDLLARHAPILVKLLPELGVAPAPDLDPPSKEKLRLQGTVSELVAGLAGRKGTVIVLEDWQWADALSAELLTYILRNAREQALMFVLNHRGAAEGDATWRASVEELALPPLDTESVGKMVTAMLGVEAVGEGFLEQISAFAEGNPFFVEGLLGHLVRNQTLVKRKGRWNTELTLTPDQMPSNLQGLLLEKLAALSEPAAAVARIGAVLGRDFGLDVLLRVSKLPEDTLFDALGELSAQGTFSRTEEGAYRFSQGQLQEVLYANMAPEEKVRLHRAVVAALEAGLEGPLAEAPLAAVTSLAHHVLLAEEPEKTVIYALEAGVRSAGLFANAEAHRFLTAGLAVLDAEDAATAATSRTRTRLDYLRTLGDVCRVSGRSAEAQEAFSAAIPLAEELGETLHLGRMLTSAAKVCQMANDYPAALAYADRSLEVCLAGGDAAGAARCLLTSCRVNYFTGKLPEAVEQTVRALALAREAGVATYIGEALGFIGLMYVSGDPDKLAEGESNLKESVTILADLGDRIGLSNAYNLLGNAQNMQGNFIGAWETFQQNKKICVEIGLKDEEIFALLNLAITAFERGAYDEVVNLALEANSIATALNSKFPLGMAYTLEAAAAAFRGELTKGLDGLQQALGLAREIQNKYLEALVQLYLLEVQLHLGRLAEARATGEALTALIQETGNTEPEGRMQALLGEVLVRLGEAEAGRALLALAVEGARRNHARGILVRALRASAWAEAQAGRHGEAERQAAEAHEAASGIGARYQVAALDCLRGELALQAGRPDLALAHYEQARQEAETLGNPLLRALALHGIASAQPFERTSKHRLNEAQRLLRGLVTELEPEPRAWFAAFPERSRVLAAEPLRPAGTPAAASADGPLGERLAALGREVLELSSRIGADQAGLAALEEDHARLERVLDLASALAGVRVPDQAMTRALDAVMRELDAERAFLILDSTHVKGQVQRGIRPDGGYQADWALATQLTAQARQAKAGVAVSDAPVDPRTREAVLADKLGVQTALALPLVLMGEVVGELYLDRETADGRVYDDRDLAFATRLAEQAVLGVRNAADAAEMEQRSRQLEMLNELAEKINETLVVDEVLDLVVKLTLEVTQAERGFLMLRERGDEEAEALVCRAAFDRDGRALLDERISMSICNKVLASGQAVTVVDATMDEEFQTAKSIMSLNLRTLMCVPLQAKGRNLGVLYVDSQAVVTTFTEKDLDLLRAIAGHSSGAIENATLYTSLNTRAAELEAALEMYRRAEHEASHDMLTGLHNRRFFQEQSAREIELSKRHHRNMSVIMLDVDHFKKFNDTYGHAVGDEVLRVVGRVLPQMVRASDIPCRFGGEEFVVLCPDTDGPGAARVAERIREAISKVELLDLEGKPVRQITASLGVSSLNPTDERVAELLERADTALYACKAGGRNQVQTWREGMLSPEELKRKEAQEKAEAEAAAARAGGTP